mmetsp:Transcript_13739/g.41003  ORF Transcript_13739/g.41003 Transcript_13739/m.41003 type:complete len:266 (-) Transcript_13739:85-882(-)
MPAMAPAGAEGARALAPVPRDPAGQQGRRERGGSRRPHAQLLGFVLAVVLALGFASWCRAEKAWWRSALVSAVVGARGAAPDLARRVRRWQLDGGSVLGLRALGAPPTQMAPPDISTELGAGTRWAECVLEYEDRGQAAEVWVFRLRDRAEFERLMHLRINRGYPPGGEANDRPVDFVAAGVSASCRERAVDASLVCAECVRLLTGGAYGNGGISVPAYPPKGAVLDCLDLSGSIAVEQGAREDGSPMITKLTETAFCNSIRVRS